jgi:hypothetical protein
MPPSRSNRLFTARSRVGNRTRTPLRDHDAPLLLGVEPSQRLALPELMAGLLRALAAPPAERAAA